MSDDLRSTALLAALMGGVLVTRLLKGYLDDYLTERRAKQLYADKREEVEKARRAAYERVQRYSDDELTQKDARELLDALKRGETSAVRTVRAFLSKALTVSEELNCVVEPIKEAEATAAELDKQFSDSGKSSDGLGQLHGIPISLKESIDVKGYDSTMGLGKFCFHPAEEDAVIVQVIKKQGGIPFVKTNVPQCLFTMECSNPIFGETLGPIRPDRSCGGSTGGEAALLARHGSPLGIGTDVAGSIRFPSHFSGICGLKVTQNRLSLRGFVSSFGGQVGVARTNGPMARDVDGLALLMRALLVPEMWRLDPLVPPMPFREDIYGSAERLRIGYYDFDGLLRASPACSRAVAVAKDALTSAGHKLVPLDHPPAFNLCLLYFENFCADGGSNFVNLLSGEVVDSTLESIRKFLLVPPFLKYLYRAFKKGYDSHRIVTLMNASEPLSACGYMNLQKCRQSYIQVVLDQWSKADVDAVICPVSAIPAPILKQSSKISAASCYSLIYSILNFPAGVVPVTTVTEDDEENLKSRKWRIDDAWDEAVREVSLGAEGLPVGVQIVARPWQEEMCLRVMKDIEANVK
ncbi:fatty-acid amide hydrolase 1-like [Oscarella lobularis]|uniref:fatty-acid amide hydrolase 1-like n=1 Tax=Oscarella lobularis TaxID=121494 RepID=UPI003313F43B